MNYKKSSTSVSLFVSGLLTVLFLLPNSTNAQDNIGMSDKAKSGMNLFQGSTRLQNGGPACVTCHNVNSNQMMPGGLYGKDLTDVYERFGVGLSGWLKAPDPPAMAASYHYNPLEEEERDNIAAFLQSVHEDTENQIPDSGNSYFLFGGILGLIIMLSLIQLIWSDRKKKMVKSDIFKRQRKAWDAKF